MPQAGHGKIAGLVLLLLESNYLMEIITLASVKSCKFQCGSRREARQNTGWRAAGMGKLGI